VVGSNAGYNGGRINLIAVGQFCCDLPVNDNNHEPESSHLYKIL
jgi:hypothetical protein